MITSRRLKELMRAVESNPDLSRLQNLLKKDMKRIERLDPQTPIGRLIRRQQIRQNLALRKKELIYDSELIVKRIKSPKQTKTGKHVAKIGEYRITRKNLIFLVLSIRKTHYVEAHKVFCSISDELLEEASVEWQLRNILLDATKAKLISQARQILQKYQVEEQIKREFPQLYREIVGERKPRVPKIHQKRKKDENKRIQATEV